MGFKLKLEKVMYDKRINTKQLGELTGIRWNTVNDMVKNESKHWSVENLNRIMAALELKDISELIEYVEEPSQE
ncbi:helix-turn-helix transcriptional regulator [Paenibacillus sp. FSL L8-0340]|uniref:helix-turn-helix domain-containing protein n=1 Tax=Paenibacillus sp. FSL L8-0340 TaxID=2954685 RepID=UPI0031598D1D